MQLRAVFRRQKSDDCVTFPNHASGTVILFHTQCGNLMVWIHFRVSTPDTRGFSEAAIFTRRPARRPRALSKVQLVSGSKSVSVECSDRKRSGIHTRECQRPRRLRPRPVAANLAQGVQMRARVSTVVLVLLVSIGPSECYCCWSCPKLSERFVLLPFLYDDSALFCAGSIRMLRWAAHKSL